MTWVDSYHPMLQVEHWHRVGPQLWSRCSPAGAHWMLDTGASPAETDQQFNRRPAPHTTLLSAFPRSTRAVDRLIKQCYQLVDVRCLLHVSKTCFLISFWMVFKPSKTIPKVLFVVIFLMMYMMITDCFIASETYEWQILHGTELFKWLVEYVM